MAFSRALDRAVRKLTWNAKSAVDLIDYRAATTRFREAANGGKVCRVDQPEGERTRHVYDFAESSTPAHGADRLRTTFGMHQRWRIVSRLYPDPLTSLLDIGCCRGWFVLQAAMRPGCEKAVGVDVVPGFIDAADAAKARVGLDNAAFHHAFLDDIAGDAARFQTPFQTVLLINTYHYLYWGSYYSSTHWADHDFLLRTLAGICTDRLIFMGPTEVADCPQDVRDRAAERPEWAAGFTTERFFEAASRHFEVTPADHIGLRPLFVLTRRRGAAA